ncbi:MAG: FkbM family methyltransferase [Limisphaerales bacterium]
MNQTDRALTFCLAEDRLGAEIGLRLAVLSVRRWCPGSKVMICRPSSTPEFKAWLSGFSEVRLLETWPSAAKGWNCKPYILLSMLAENCPEVVWLDSDLMLANDCRKLFHAMTDEEIGVVEEQASSPNHGSEIRTRGWGLPVGRRFPNSMNSCVVRVTRHHTALMRRWVELLESEEYQRMETVALEERPVHVLGDQDVLCALLGSEEFVAIPVRYFRRGVDVLHSGGALAYPAIERLRGVLLPKPSFIHAGGTKPWVVLNKSRNLSGFFWWYRRILQETSPYVAEARRYRHKVGESCPWLDWHTLSGVTVRLLGFGHFGLRGLPLAAAARVAESFRRFVRSKQAASFGIGDARRESPEPGAHWTTRNLIPMAKTALKLLFARKIIGGPFRGMRYLGYSCGSVLLPKIVGTYELELHQCLNQLFASLSHSVVIAGAAEGYYAVGFLLRNAEVHLCAFESDEEARRALRELARINGVLDRLEIRDRCEVDSLAQVLKEQPVDLLFMDVEGYERELLDPERLPELRRQLILVEVHDCIDPSISKLLRQRFQPSHRIEAITARPRRPDDIAHPFYRWLAKASAHAAQAFLWERAPDTGWLLLAPHDQPIGS